MPRDKGYYTLAPCRPLAKLSAMTSGNVYASESWQKCNRCQKSTRIKTSGVESCTCYYDVCKATFMAKGLFMSKDVWCLSVKRDPQHNPNVLEQAGQLASDVSSTRVGCCCTNSGQRKSFSLTLGNAKGLLRSASFQEVAHIWGALNWSVLSREQDWDMAQVPGPSPTSYSLPILPLECHPPFLLCSKIGSDSTTPGLRGLESAWGGHCKFLQ